MKIRILLIMMSFHSTVFCSYRLQNEQSEDCRDYVSSFAAHRYTDQIEFEYGPHMSSAQIIGQFKRALNRGVVRVRPGEKYNELKTYRFDRNGNLIVRYSEIPPIDIVAVLKLYNDNK